MSSAPADDGFNVTSTPGFSFDADHNNPIMWGGMQQLSLDKSLMNQSNQNMFDQQMAANHISQYGQITPPNDVDNPLKMEDSPAHMTQGVEDTPATSTRSKRPTSKRASREKEESSTDKSKKTTRKARKGYKATTIEEENDSDGEMKRERFLERNRVAASKCRQKKKQWTNGLEGHARELAAANANLHACAMSLKEEVLYLKSECLKHTDCGCSRIREYLDRSIAGMAPSNTMGMMAKPEDPRSGKHSKESPYSFDSQGSPTLASDGVGSRHGSMSADSQLDVQMMDDSARAEQDMQALIEASFAAPDGNVAEQSRVT